MRLLHQQQKTQLICLFFIFVTSTISIPIKENIQNIRCDTLQPNCTFPRSNSSSDSLLHSTYFQKATQRTTRQRISTRLTLSRTYRSSTTKTKPASSFDTFGDNLKRAALILAGVALGLGILRICLMLCKSRSGNNSFSHRHSASVRPQIATIEHHQFKPDLPPAYAEAITNIENDGGKLPSYEELPYEQRQEQQVHNNDGFISTQM